MREPPGKGNEQQQQSLEEHERADELRLVIGIFSRTALREFLTRTEIHSSGRVRIPRAHKRCRDAAPPCSPKAAPRATYSVLLRDYNNWVPDSEMLCALRFPFDHVVMFCPVRKWISRSAQQNNYRAFHNVILFFMYLPDSERRW